ncbi:MAG TPA: glycosyltransferase family 2 protein [Desulfobacteria bacterium]|nr:glycosyltransferase family 2 protein [Desulfobacteria bacterium]
MPASSILSVVVPAYNEELVIEETNKRLTRVLSSLDLDYEIIYVDDGSKDQTIKILTRLANTDPHLKILSFSRNFGHQVAVTAGIQHATGDAVVLIDADLQDPPELIKEFVAKWREGYDVVYAIRKKREGETWFKKFTASMFYRILHKLIDIEIPLDTGDFRLMSRRVVDSLNAMPERHRFVRGLVSWVGFKQTGIEYERHERFAGETKYPLKKMIKFALDGITSFSYKPLQLASTLGICSAGVGFIGILLIIILKLFTTVTIQGWSSLMVVVLFIGGIQLAILGIIGEYIGRMYDEIRKRPLYLLQDQIGFAKGTNADSNPNN